MKKLLNFLRKEYIEPFLKNWKKEKSKSRGDYEEINL